MTTTIQYLRHSSKSSPAILGGKGFHLHLAHKLNFEIPYTIVLTTEDVQESVLSDSGLQEKLASFQSLTYKKLLELPDQPLQDDFDALPALSLLREKSVAISWELGGMQDIMVRSSANIEDGARSSFAGVFDSFKIENTSEKIYQTILQVIRSFYTKQAILEALAAKMDLTDLMPAVIIQPFIKGDCYGVATSRESGKMFLEKPEVSDTFGRVECSFESFSAVTSGEGEIFHFKMGEAQKTLPEECHNALKEVCVTFEKRLRSPVEIEWVWSKKRLVLLQCRPLTCPESQVVKNTTPGVVWNRDLTLERFQKPLSPLGWSIMTPSIESGLRGFERFFGLCRLKSNDLALNFSGFIYANERVLELGGGTPVRWSRLFRSSVFRQAIVSIVPAITTYIKAVLNFQGSSLKREFVSRLVANSSRHLVRKFKRHEQEVRKELERIEESTQVGILTPEELVKFIDRLVMIGKKLFKTDFCIHTVKTLGFRMLGSGESEGVHVQSSISNIYNDLSQLRQSFPSDDRLQELLTKVSSNDMQKGGADGFYLYLTADESRAWRMFCERYGHWRSSWDIRELSWGEDIPSLIQLLQNTPLKRMERESYTEDKEISETFYDLIELAKIDEEQHFWAAKLLSVSRTVVKQTASTLQRMGALKTSELIYFLTLEELRSALSGQLPYAEWVAQNRKVGWESTSKWDVPRVFNPHDPKPVQRGFSGYKGIVKGSVSGPAHIADDISQLAKAAPGSVLVTTALKPEFAPYFHLFRAVVSKTGGWLSHGFVAASAIGLPAVAGWNSDLDDLKNGQFLKVDASQGKVKVLLRE